jgi:hypothetical protein
MNAFWQINKVLGVCFAIAVVGVGVYKGLEAFDRGKREMVRKGRKQFEKRLQESADSLPPGLNGEYPSDGPMAEYYRNNRTVSGQWVPVGP